MIKEKIYRYLILASIAMIVLSGGVFAVDQRQQALIVQFGEVVKLIDKPGLKLKIPFIQDVIFFDKRILDLGINEQEVIAADQKRLIIDAFTKYRIIDPLKFYTTVNNRINAESKLIAILDSHSHRTNIKYTHKYGHT